MQICPRCNFKIQADGASFCPECGEALDRTGANASASPATGPESSSSYNAAQPPSTKSKKPWVIVGAVLALLLVVFFFRGPISRLFLGGDAYAATLVSAETDLFFVFNPDLEQVENFKRVKDIYLAIPEVKQAWDDLLRDLKKDTDLDLEADVKPWLGTEAALIMPDLRTLEGSREPGLLVAIETRNKKKSDACLAKIRQKQESNGVYFEEKEYQKVKITVEKSNYNPLIYATTKNFVLLSNDEYLIRQAIEKSQNRGQNSLAKHEDYQAITEKLPKSRAGTLYLDYKDLTRLVVQETDPALRQLIDLEAYKGMGLSVSCVKEGVRWDYAIAYDPQKIPESLKQATGNASALKKTTEMVSNETLVYVGAGNLKLGLEEALKAVDKNSNLYGVRDGLREIERETGLNLEQDILAWLKGEAAVVLLPENAGLFGEKDVPLGFLAVIGVSDPKMAESKLQKLESRLSEEGAIINTDTIGGQKVSYILEPYGRETLAGYGIRDNYLLIGTSRGIIQQTMGKVSDPLASSPTYKQALKELPEPEDCCLFVDVDKGLELLNRTLSPYEREEFDREVYPYLKPIKAFSITQKTDTKAGLSNGAILVTLEG